MCMASQFIKHLPNYCMKALVIVIFFVVILLHQATSNLHYLVTFQGPTWLPFSEKQNIVRNWHKWEKNVLYP